MSRTTKNRVRAPSGPRPGSVRAGAIGLLSTALASIALVAVPAGQANAAETPRPRQSSVMSDLVSIG